ncbi:MAG TPA: hypothetical protein VGC71_12050 [Gaiellales bacterium]|jgi:hypothetical protein
MGRLFGAFRYANVVSTAAIVVALSGTAYAAGITGNEIADGTVTNLDLQDRTIRGKDIHLGTIRAENITALGRALLHVRAAPPAISDYHDLSPIVKRRLRYRGYYVVFTEFLATNTGSTDDSLNCAYKLGGTVSPAAGVQAASEQSSKAQSVTVIHATVRHELVRFACQRNDSSSFTLSHIRFAAFRFG